MKVAIIDFLPSVVHYDMYLVSSIAKILPDVEFITKGYTREEDYFKALEKSVRVKYINKYSKNIKLLRKQVKLFEYLLIDLPSLFFYFKKNNFQILHFQLIYPIPGFVDLLLIFLAKLFGIKVVYTVHNVLPHNYSGKNIKDKISYIFYKYLYKTVDRIIAHSQNMKEDIISIFGIKEDKLSVIPHGVLFFNENTKISKNETKKRLGLSYLDKVILFQGFMSPYKGVEYLVEAFPLIYKEIPKVKLLIVGTGEKEYVNVLKKKIEFMLVQYNIPRKAVIEKFDYIEAKDLPLYFQVSEVVVLPYTEVSQSGVLLTAYTFGKPIVCSNIGAFKETVCDNVNGYLVKPKDSKAIADAVISIISNENKIKTMGHNSYMLAKEKYSWEVIALKTIQLYKNLIKLK